MIVKRYFKTGRSMDFNVRNWCGYFLFGFIPMYIKEIR